MDREAPAIPSSRLEAAKSRPHGSPGMTPWLSAIQISPSTPWLPVLEPSC